MSILPCHGDLVALGLVEEEDGHRYWRMDQLRGHVARCSACSCLLDVFSAMTGAQGGRAGRGAAKRRGGSAYYRALAARKRIR
jgi:hypothetical protein